MCYLGNDIVDFSSPETHQKFLNARFLNRVYSSLEQRAILAASDPDVMLWGLWAIKEASYKACAQYAADLYFSPRTFELTDPVLEGLSRCLAASRTFNGQCNWRDQTIKIAVKRVASHVVHAVALLVTRKNTTSMTKVVTQLQCLNNGSSYPKQSKAVRMLLKDWMRAQGFADDAQVIRSAVNGKARLGPPCLHSLKNDLSSFRVSLSHDGRWVGFSLVHEKN